MIDELVNEINNFQKVRDSLYSKWWLLLKTYYEDIAEEFHEDWHIIDITEDLYNICVLVENCYNDEYTCNIPKEWIENPTKYIRHLNKVRKERLIDNVNMDITKCKKTINDTTSKLVNLERKLQELQNNDLLNSICMK